jgi:hypothetical protein
MSAQHQHSTVRRAALRRHLGVAAAILTCAGLAACTAAEPLTSTTSPPSVPAVPLALPDGALEAGTYLFDGLAVPFEVTVPDGWTFVQGAALRKDVGDTEGVFVWFGRASHVPADACRWPGTLAEISPSVDGFSDALAAQTSTTTTAPVDVSVGDYSGVEFDLSVEGVTDLTDCSGAKICIHSEAESCTRWYSGSVAQRETYRVLDLDGDRAILSVGEYDDKTRAPLLEEARAVFDSITFASD